jgi:hypothetical protein
VSSPISEIAIVPNNTGPGHRTMAAPILRQPRIRMARLGSSMVPKRLATVISAGPSVNATNTPTVIPTASGMPNVWKYGSRVNDRQKVAPAMVMPDPSTTWAVPWNIV